MAYIYLQTKRECCCFNYITRFPNKDHTINYMAYIQTKGECCFNYITRFPKKDYYKEKRSICILELLVMYEALFSGF